MNQCFWCDICQGQVFKDCGHPNLKPRDITPGKTYQCYVCGLHEVDVNCGHICFGDEKFLLPPPSERYYYCYVCKTRKIGGCKGHSCATINMNGKSSYRCCCQSKNISSPEGCTDDCYGSILSYIDLTPGRLFYCTECKQRLRYPQTNCKCDDEYSYSYGNMSCEIIDQLTDQQAHQLISDRAWIHEVNQSIYMDLIEIKQLHRKNMELMRPKPIDKKENNKINEVDGAEDSGDSGDSEDSGDYEESENESENESVQHNPEFFRHD